MTECVRAANEKPTEGKDRVLRQMGRELLLAQSSDWAFFYEDRNGSRVCSEEDKGSCPAFHSPL
jgi:predicted glycosyl hydrolase (DUF1957 family)